MKLASPHLSRFFLTSQPLQSYVLFLLSLFLVPRYNDLDDGDWHFDLFQREVRELETLYNVRLKRVLDVYIETDDTIVQLKTALYVAQRSNRP